MEVSSDVMAHSPPATLPLFYDTKDFDSSKQPSQDTSVRLESAYEKTPIPAEETRTTKNPFDIASRPIPSQASVVSLLPEHIPSFRRLLTTLLPVKYPDSFYNKLISNADGLWSTYVALWHGNVVGRICARLEPCDIAAEYTYRDAQKVDASTDYYDLYLSHLAVLAPYRSYGLATCLLQHASLQAQASVQGLSTASPSGCSLRTVYAHVWERNDDALEWYAKRGFTVEKELIQSYYRRLKPGGARIVRKKLALNN